MRSRHLQFFILAVRVSVCVTKHRTGPNRLGIDDVEHFLLQCTMHDDLRHVLKQDILEVWERREDRGGLNLSVQLLFPFAIDQLTYVECHEVLSATFSYIKNSQRQL